MFKWSKALILCLILCIGFFVPFESKASVPEFYVDYAEPNSSDNQGYMVLLLENQNEGYRRVATYFWNTLGVTSSSAESQTYGYIDLTHTTLSFTIAGTGSLNSVYYNFNEINTDGVYKMVKASTTERTNLNFGESGWRIIGYQYKGAVQVNTGMKNQVFRINFNTDGSAILLQSQLSVLMDIKNLNMELRYRLEKILNASVSIEEKIEQLKAIENEQNALLEESNTWLEKIFNWLKDSPEEEKNQASTQGGNSVSEGTNAIEDKGQGFTNSLNGLVGSMSYNGTECSWTFPTVKLPAISGVMSETTLIQSQDINFGMWIDAIPSDIMLLIRSVLTMGLIVYCFKEFYDTIAYVLTLRRSDNE